MKFDCGESAKEFIERVERWHPWFAWRPVRVASHDCRWLETVARKGKFHQGFEDWWVTWEYAPLEGTRNGEDAL